MTIGLDDDIKAFHRKFVTGLTVVTTTAAGRPYGLCLNAFASVSLSPATILVCVAHSSSTHDVLLRAQRFAVNLLAYDQLAIAQRFATRDINKFGELPWRIGEYGSPVLDGVCACLEAEITSRVPTSTHTVFFGEVLGAVSCDRPPLVYAASQFFDGAELQPVPS